MFSKFMHGKDEEELRRLKMIFLTELGQHLNRITRFAGADLEKTINLIEAAQHDALQYEVEEILETKVKEGEVQLLVSWLGFTKEDDSWEPAVDMFDYVPKLVLAALCDADSDPVIEDLLHELRGS